MAEEPDEDDLPTIAYENAEIAGWIVQEIPERDPPYAESDWIPLCSRPRAVEFIVEAKDSAEYWEQEHDEMVDRLDRMEQDRDDWQSRCENCQCDCHEDPDNDCNTCSHDDD